MSDLLKSTISYRDAEDLTEFVSFLGDRVVKFDIRKKQNGRYKKADIYCRNPQKKRREPCK